MQRRDFLKGTAAALTGAMFGFASPKMVPVVIDVHLEIAKELLLPIKDAVYFEGWAAHVFKVYPVDMSQMIGPEWWMTDEELARLPPQEITAI